MNIYNILSSLRTFYVLHCAAGKVYSQTSIRHSSTLTTKDIPLHPQWITGFTDGEGSFGVKISKAKGYKLGWKLQPFFQIKLNVRDLDTLYRIQKYFGGIGTGLRPVPVPSGPRNYRFLRKILLSILLENLVIL